MAKKTTSKKAKPVKAKKIAAKKAKKPEVKKAAKIKAKVKVKVAAKVKEKKPVAVKKTKPAAKSKNSLTPEILQSLIEKGRSRGFVTFSEILFLMPNIEENIEELDKLYQEMEKQFRKFQFPIWQIASLPEM